MKTKDTWKKKMQAEAGRFKRRALRLTPQEEKRMRQPLTNVLLDVRLPVAMQLCFEAGAKWEHDRSAERKRTKLSQFLAGKRSSKGIEGIIREDKRKGASRG